MNKHCFCHERERAGEMGGRGRRREREGERKVEHIGEGKGQSMGSSCQIITFLGSQFFTHAVRGLPGPLLLRFQALGSLGFRVGMKMRGEGRDRSLQTEGLWAQNKQPVHTCSFLPRHMWACRLAERLGVFGWKAPWENRDNYWPWGIRRWNGEIGPLRPLVSLWGLSSLPSAAVCRLPCLPLCDSSLCSVLWLVVIKTVPYFQTHVGPGTHGQHCVSFPLAWSSLQGPAAFRASQPQSEWWCFSAVSRLSCLFARARAPLLPLRISRARHIASLVNIV